MSGKRTENVFLEKRTKRKREREKKESRERGSECQTATDGSPMAHLKNEG